MRLLVWLAALACSVLLSAAQNPLDEARKLERTGDISAARATLRRAAESAPRDTSTLAAYAEFLDRHNLGDRRDAYEKALAAAGASEAGSRVRILRRMVVLDLLAGDHAAANRHLADYRVSACRIGCLRQSQPRRTRCRSWRSPVRCARSRAWRHSRRICTRKT
jgi:Flp pilus assembly protein TadD